MTTNENVQTPLEELPLAERAIAVHYRLSAVWGAMPYAGGIVRAPRIGVIAEEGRPESGFVTGGWDLELVLEHLERLKVRLEGAAKHDQDREHELLELREALSGAEVFVELVVGPIVERKIDAHAEALAAAAKAATP